MTRWVILTGEYPPQSGGVSDYTRLVAEGLAAAGDEVTVYASPQSFGPDLVVPGVRVRRLLDRFGPRGLLWLDRELTRDRPDRVLIQYVPHAFGLKAMNVPFAFWVAARAPRMAQVWVMFHEVAFPFVRRPLRHNLLAIVNRVMARAIAAAADRVLISIPGWGPLLSRICPKAQPAKWLPVPCIVGSNADPETTAAIRVQYAPNPAAMLVGHFGTFGRLITDLLEPAVVELLRTTPRVRILFIGRGSDRFATRIGAAQMDLAARVTGTGELPAEGVAAHLRACDVLLQPYPDGVSSRRTSVMAGLANVVPVVTNLGALSEPLWTEAAGVMVVPGPDPAALASAVSAILTLPIENRIALASRGADLYRTEFAFERIIAQLRNPDLTVDDTAHR